MRLALNLTPSLDPGQDTIDSKGYKHVLKMAYARTIALGLASCCSVCVSARYAEQLSISVTGSHSCAGSEPIPSCLSPFFVICSLALCVLDLHKQDCVSCSQRIFTAYILSCMCINIHQQQQQQHCKGS